MPDLTLAPSREFSEAQIGRLLRAELARALCVTADEIDPATPFVSMGMDSLMAMELRGRVQDELGTAVPITQFFINPTIETLARGLLKLWQASQGRPSPPQDAIAPAMRQGPVALSYAQEQIWFLHQLVPTSSVYNVAVKITLRGPLDAAALASSLEAVVARHEVLRTGFRSQMGVPEAFIADAGPFELPVHEVADEAALEAWCRRDSLTAFDLATGALWRARLLRISAGHHVLLLIMHHIIVDGWSLGVLLQELGEVYTGLQQRRAPVLPDAEIQYRDFAAWQRQRLQGRFREGLVGYWKGQLAGAATLKLPSDFSANSGTGLHGARSPLALGRSRAAALRRFCERENITLFTFLLTAFSALLQRYSGQDRFVIGTLSANRARLEFQRLIGLFANALPVHVRFDGDPTGRAALGRMRALMLDVLAHEELPFEHIVSEVGQAREGVRNPLFDVQFVLQGTASRFAFADLTIEVSEIDTQTAKRDLTLMLFDDETLSGHIEYATSLFAPARIEQLARQLGTIIDQILADPDARLSSLTPVDEAELIPGPIRVVPPLSQARSAARMFEAAVDRAPDALAVLAGERRLTYAQLDAAANRFARWLQRRGVQAGTPVALRVARGPELPIGLLGILKAGGVYVPIDPTYPIDRADFIRTDSQAALLVDNLDDEIAGEPDTRLDAVAEGADLAYVMYTSGSTGRPKGVMVTHGGLVEYAETLAQDLGITPHDRYLHSASMSFSSSIRQFFVPFAAGAAIVMAGFEECRDPLAWLACVRDNAVTVVDLVPTMVRHIVTCFARLDAQQRAERLENLRLRLLLTASEVLRFGLVTQWRAQFGHAAVWVHMYGQTETTGIVSLYCVPERGGAPGQIVPIGRPRGNVTLRVLDQLQRPLPAGVPGELYVGGAALAQSYTPARAPAGARFCTDPASGMRLYATGDVVQRGWDGVLGFIGRSDQQVKLRGMRVALGEIESVLLEHPGIAQAVVTLHGQGSDNERLVAYVAAKAGDITAGMLRGLARQKLPAHMVPAVFVPVREMPTTPNGKIDRSALPQPEAGDHEALTYMAPRPGLEMTIAGIWSELLRVARVSTTDNFFSLGGNSLLAVQVRARITQSLGVELPLAAIFEDQTLAALALRIRSQATRPRKLALPRLRRLDHTTDAPASYAQQQMWQCETEAPGARALWIEVAVRISGPLEVERLAACVHAAVQRHALLRTIFRREGEALRQVVVARHLPELLLRDGAGPAAGWEPVDLANCPPFRISLVRASAYEHHLHLHVHRVLADGFSIRLLLTEIFEHYALHPGAMAEPAIRYLDYGAWEQGWLRNEVLAREIDYFCRDAGLADQAFALPIDKAGQQGQHGRSARIRFPLAPEISAAVEALARREGASPHMVVLAAYAAAIGRFAQQHKVVIGSPVSRRELPGCGRLLGPMMNTLPLCLDLPETTDLAALVSLVKAQMLAALAHQDAPFHLVRAQLAALSPPAADALNQVVLVMADPAPGEFALGDLLLTPMATKAAPPLRPLTLSIATSGGERACIMTYNASLFTPSTIQRLTDDFLATLAAAADQIS